MKKNNQFILGLTFGFGLFLFMGQSYDLSSRYLKNDEVGRFQGFGRDHANRYLIDTKTGQMFWYDHRTSKGWIYEKNSDALFFEDK
ncbi:MAG: hypothetical protein CBD97_02645 [Pelagibacteraceae bacterium TMED237]|nr:hypothetical protein [Candidatus Neomarinimicrobiota bacterium]OUW95605.1 MAG: hypothetical protein CBD97_02645 [Pelagibacteraceae bacterium TMED237]|tara:strand:+ start:10069 stop:10326 length:258 start_codon:yes stop_codon:yes gene_type:complete